MFGLFKKKSEYENLLKKYAQLMSQSHKLSTINRTKSDAVYAEANQVLEALSVLEKK